MRSCFDNPQVSDFTNGNNNKSNADFFSQLFILHLLLFIHLCVLVCINCLTNVHMLEYMNERVCVRACVCLCVRVCVCVWLIRVHWIKPIISNSAQIQQICLPASNHITLAIMPTSSVYCTHTHTHTHIYTVQSMTEGWNY